VSPWLGFGAAFGPSDQVEKDPPSHRGNVRRHRRTTWRGATEALSTPVDSRGLVFEVIPGSQAEQYELKVNDVILGINRQRVRNVADFERLLVEGLQKGPIEFCLWTMMAW